MAANEAGQLEDGERCAACQLSKLDEIDAGPLGETVRRASKVRQLSEIVTLTPANILADEFAAITLLKEEQPQEQQQPNAFEYPNARRPG